MKKILVTAMALLTIASASAFGMYGDQDSWIDFLVHGNQLRARMDQLGFVLGNGTIKGTFGFRSQAATTLWGNILTTGSTGNVDLTTTISAGIGYTSEPFGIGVGYNYTFINKNLGVHTPVLMINALNNNLRIAIPVQIAVSDNAFNETETVTKKDYMGVSTDIQIRYYTGIDAFNAIRVYFKYGQAGYKYGINDRFAQSVGFETRFYFLNTTVGNVNINPFIKVAYNTALYGFNRTVRAGDVTVAKHPEYNSLLTTIPPEDIEAGYALSSFSTKDVKWDSNPYDVKVQAVLGITANSDIVSLYVEPSLGYQATYLGKLSALYIDAKVQHKLAWGAYTELYIRPVQDLEWYFEMDVNNSNEKQNGVPVNFATSTGITWYLPALN
uniref:cell surface protein n=1 Tax=Brachyspira catarrhinii TaxID=2528966 RepID=UPI003F4B12A1